MEKHVLSKSSFIKGIQCEKALYLSKFHKDLKDDLSAQQEAIFSQGTKVGELAQNLYPGGIDCSSNSFDYQKAVLKTKEEIANGATILYEAAFQFNGVLALLDILVKEGDSWKGIEVKSSTSISDTYKLDATIQYYVISNSGIELEDISIAYINNKYTKDGDIDVKKLFTITSVLDDVLDRLPSIPSEVERLKNVLLKKETPNIEPGVHCTNPYDCDFSNHCWKKNNNPIFEISRLTTVKKFELLNKGITSFEDIPDSYPLNEKQWQQVNADINNTSIIDKPKIKSFINKLEYPLYFLDFETFATAIPILDQSRPYQQLVFQYSLHIQKEDKTITHKEFLAETNGKDPRRDFTEQMIKDCGSDGSVLVYNISFERSKIQDLITIFPEYTDELTDIIDRMVDLMVPFQQKSYYTPSMRGSYSIKKVLPALVPSLSYKDLEIQEGGSASNIFASMFMGDYAGDIEKTRKDLLEYCKLDTFAMVEILEVLKNV